MNHPTVGWLCEVLGAAPPALDPKTLLGPISIDSRSLKPGETFWALRGTRDGHEFVLDAFAKGAKLEIVNRDWWELNQSRVQGHPVIHVTDTRAALTQAGRMWRKRFSFPVIGITGTNGKTSTKDLMLRLLVLRYKTAGTKGNLNNELGVPLTLLDIPADRDMAVVEMGANHAGEIRQLCEISRPTHGLVTSIGKAHLDGFGNLATLAHAKGELYDAVAEDGVAFVPTDDELCRSEAAGNRRKIGYGFLPRPKGWSDEFHGGENLRYDDRGCASFQFDGTDIALSIPGKPPAISAIAALTVGNHFGITAEEARHAVRTWPGMHGRMNIFTVGGVTVMDDSYNANPPSMEAALETLSYLRGKRRIAILGDMNELGEFAEDEHRKLGETVAQSKVDQAIFLGPLSKHAAESASRSGVKTVYFADCDSLEPELSKLIREGDVVLIKGSRGMKLERVAEHLKKFLA